MDDQLVLHGLLQDLKFPDLLQLLLTRKETGELQIKKATGIRSIFFDQGVITAVVTEDTDESIASYLLLSGKLSLREFQAVKKLATKELSQEEVLISGGFISEEELHFEGAEHARFILQNLLEERSGQYEFLRGNQPQSDMKKVRLTVPEIFIMCASKVWRWSSIDELIGAPENRFVRADNWHATAVHLSIPPGALSLLAALEKPHSAGEIVALSPMSEFDTCKWIWCFFMTGILQKAEVEEQEPTEEITLPFHSEITQSDITASQNLAGLTEENELSPGPSPADQNLETTLKLKAEQLPGLALTSEAAPPEQTKVSTVEMERPALPESLAADSNIHRIAGQTPPTVELSFSDLSEISDSQEAGPPIIPARPLSAEERLKKDVHDFNERHRYLFELLRIEVGPQISNYVERAKKKATLKYPLVFDGAHMNEFGEFSERSLVLNIEGNLFERHMDAFRYFLDEERRIVEPHVEPKRVEQIYAGLSKIEARQKNYLPA